MDPNNQTATNPQSVDEPSIVPDDMTAPQGDAGDSGQAGNAPAADGGGEPGQTQAPELPKWHYQLTGDLQGHELLRDHASPSDTAKAYRELASKADRMVELPGDDADEQAREAFLSRLRPETPEDYTLELPDGIPEGMYNAEWEKEFRKTVHELGLTNEQAKELHRRELQQELSTAQEQAKARKEKFDQLKKEWGDKFDGNLNEVQTAFKTVAQKMGDNTLAQRMVESGYGNDPDMMRMFHGIWQMIKPDTLVEGSVDGGSGGGDLAETYYPETNFDS